MDVRKSRAWQFESRSDGAIPPGLSYFLAPSEDSAWASQQVQTIAYINSQEEDHRKRSCEDEFIAFLETSQ